MAFLQPNCGDAGYKIIWLKREPCGADGVRIWPDPALGGRVKILNTGRMVEARGSEAHGSLNVSTSRRGLASREDTRLRGNSFAIMIDDGKLAKMVSCVRVLSCQLHSP